MNALRLHNRAIGLKKRSEIGLHVRSRALVSLHEVHYSRRQNNGEVHYSGWQRGKQRRVDHHHTVRRHRVVLWRGFSWHYIHDSLLSSCRTMPVPGPTLRYKKRSVSYRTGMQKKRPLGSFEVAMDAIQHGTDKVVKSFTYFDSRDHFFRETAYTVHRNFYEIIPAGDPCCLYLMLNTTLPVSFMLTAPRQTTNLQ